MTTAIETPAARTLDMKFEIVVIPVSDVDRAKRFYGGLGVGKLRDGRDPSRRRRPERRSLSNARRRRRALEAKSSPPKERVY